MNKIYLFYLMCIGISLTFLSTYFSIFFPDYSNSILYIVTIMFVSSILFLMFLEGKVKIFASKLMVLSSFFLLLYFSSIIVKNLFFLTIFGEEVISVFSAFFFLCSVSLMMIASLSLRNEAFFNNNGLIALIFSPVIIYSLWVLFNNALFSTSEIFSQVPLRLFIIFFTSIYSFIIFYNLFFSARKVLALKDKYFIIAAGFAVLFLSSGFRIANFFFELSSIFSVIGSFTICFGLMIESSLNLHQYMLNVMVDSLSEKKKKDFLKFLKNSCSKRKDLIINISNKVVIVDNPSLSNIDEKQSYDKVIISSYKWFRKHVKGSSELLNNLKVFYNKQAFMSKKLNLMLI
ncbi:MAG: hypothetical protein JW791_02815 [Nanoarchaeota archaeon]|nr:hypothetical protein [Nanoarchaeota archaeon]